MVVGDTAHLEENGRLLPGVAPVAMQQGTYAGKRVLRLMRGQQIKPFHYVDKGNLAIIGRRAAIADFGWLRLHGFVAFVVWAVVHIFYLINFRNRAASDDAVGLGVPDGATWRAAHHAD